MGNWLLRILVVLLLLRLLWHLLRGVVEGWQQGGRRERERGVALARDPVCGTFVVPGRALATRRRGVAHYFCSERCRQAFVRSGRHGALRSALTRRMGQ